MAKQLRFTYQNKEYVLEYTRRSVEAMEKKGFVAHKSFGKSHEYYPVVDRQSYTRGFMSNVLNNFFGGSVGNMVSFLSHEKSISVAEADDIIKMLKGEE